MGRLLYARPMRIADGWDAQADVSLHAGDTRHLLAAMPDGCAQLVITSPPYNLAKVYERRRRPLDAWAAEQAAVIAECVRVLAPGGSLCWQIGNHVADGAVLPLDLVLWSHFTAHDCLRLRNRIVWHFAHGLHCTRRFSGRYEVVLWFTKGDPYRFDLDPVRVPQKYPGKRAWKGPRAGTYTGNPAGKNPGDVWVFPNVKANHVEKTIHPCQFPVELVERFVLAVTAPGDLVVDPYLGVGSTACAAVLHGRRAAGAETMPAYVAIARERIALAAQGALRTRPMHRPVHEPDSRSALARRDDPAPRAKQARPRTPAQGLRLTAAVLARRRDG
ncbi:MAG: site-specific DNA-methyltransferase [bacterium]|nr:site-specific DNA-methyltransferase [bacterium]